MLNIINCHILNDVYFYWLTYLFIYLKKSALLYNIWPKNGIHTFVTEKTNLSKIGPWNIKNYFNTVKIMHTNRTIINGAVQHINGAHYLSTPKCKWLFLHFCVTLCIKLTDLQFFPTYIQVDVWNWLHSAVLTYISNFSVRQQVWTQARVNKALFTKHADKSKPQDKLSNNNQVIGKQLRQDKSGIENQKV